MKLQPGDHVAQKDLTDEQYHAIAKKFMEAGANQGEYGEIIRREEFPFFGWGLASNRLHHGSTNGKHSNYFDGRTLTPSQILEDDVWSGEGMPKIGTEVEVWYDDGRVCWNRAYVVGHKRDEQIIAASLIGDHQDKLIWAETFRPIKSDRDKVVEAARKALSELEKFSISSIAESLFDAGLLKLPEGDK